MVGGDFQRADALGLHVPEEVHEVSAVGLDRVVRQERIADPGDQGPGGGRGVGSRGGQRLGQEGLDLVGGRGVPIEEVAPLGHEGDPVWDQFRFRLRGGRNVACTAIGPMFCTAIGVHAHTTSCRADHQAVARHLDHRRGHPESVVDGEDPGDRRQEPAEADLGQGFKEPLELSPPARLAGGGENPPDLEIGGHLLQVQRCGE